VARYRWSCSLAIANLRVWVQENALVRPDWSKGGDAGRSEGDKGSCSSQFDDLSERQHGELPFNSLGAGIQSALAATGRHPIAVREAPGDGHPGLPGREELAVKPSDSMVASNRLAPV
jgi:hypothetical protein